ncbi:MAG: glycoside-pentoside-hexuronide (GPH):cation symporter [Terracidiphilus sp.]|jgi:GPH family glycoside/pentoside/hexuronide:cation symporter
MKPKAQRLTFAEKTGYAFGDAASNLFWMTFIYFQSKFYTDVFFYTPDAKLEDTLLKKLAVLLLLTRFFDMGFDLFMGVMGDRTWTRWGKFRPYLLWFAVPFGIISFLTFTTPGFSPNGKLIYAYITLSLMMMVYSAINIPYSALMGVISPDSQERTSVSSYRFAFAFGAGMIVQYSTLYLVDYFGHVRQGMSGMALAAAEAHGYQLTMGLYAVVATALFFLTFALTKERIQPAPQNTSLGRDFSDLATNVPWLILFFTGTLTVCSVAIRSGAILYYFQYYVGNEKLSAAFMVAGALLSCLGAAAIQHVTRFAGRKATYIGLAVLGSVFLAVSYWVKPEQIVVMFAFQVLYSAVTGPTSPVLWAMFADSADYSEWRTGRRATGLIFSAAGMSNKLGWAIGGPVAIWLLASFGYQAGVAQTHHALHAILLLFTVIPAVGFLLTGLGMILYPLNEARMKKLQGELQARHAATEAADLF